jgi:hypothetical protein
VIDPYSGDLDVPEPGHRHNAPGTNWQAQGRLRETTPALGAGRKPQMAPLPPVSAGHHIPFSSALTRHRPDINCLLVP